MKQHSFVSHTPEEIRRLSNLAHIVEGALFAVVGPLALLGNLGVFTGISLAWPILVLIAGMTELLSSRTPALNYVWPTAMVLTGGLFLLHAQRGTAEAAASGFGYHAHCRRIAELHCDLKRSEARRDPVAHCAAHRCRTVIALSRAAGRL